MTKISPSQLRAARGLLNWSRAELSKLSGISEPTLHRYENGAHGPIAHTVNKLFEVFDRHGVEFLDNQGVQFKRNNIYIYDGKERFNDFYDFLYEQLSQFGGDVCASLYDDTLPTSLRKDPSLHPKRMKKLFDRKKITFRILTTISEFGPTGYAVYRWLPKQLSSPTCFYVFGDCLALLSFVDISSPHVIVIRSGPLAEGYRQNFNIAWEHAEKPPPASEIAKMLSRLPKDRLFFTSPKK